MHRSIVLVVVAFVAVSNSQAYRRIRNDDQQCPESGFFQDADDCQKFYRCAELPTETGSITQRYEFMCPPGTVFDENISVCNHANAVEQVSPQCLAAVGATLEEIYRRPNNDDGQYKTHYSTGPFVNKLSTSTKPFNTNYKNNSPYYNTYQQQPQAHLQHTIYQAQIPLQNIYQVNQRQPYY